MNTINNYFLSMLCLCCIGMIACSDDDGPSPSLTVTPTTLDLGEVFSGTSSSADITVTGANLAGSISLSVTGADLELSQSSLPVANVTHTITVTLTPTETTPIGATTAEVIIEADGITETVSVTASVIAPPVVYLDPGTIIYASDFEFGSSDHGSSLAAEQLDGAATSLEGVTITHTITHYDGGDDGARVQANFSMCDDTISGGTASADDGDDTNGACGNAFSIQGVQSAGSTSVEIAVSGLEAGQPATVTYWIRPHGSSERGLDAMFTGGDTHEYRSTDGDSGTYTQFTNTGLADESGNLVFKVESAAPADNTSRGISIDNLTIEAGS